MKTYEFSIIASGLDPRADDFESRFYEAGCDDATISFQKGHIIVDFSREAETADIAIASAVKDVIAAGATVEHIEPDPLVSLSDIAKRTGLTRSAMSLYAQGKRGKNFPAPVARITSDNPLWCWADVAKWLFRHKKVARDVAIEAFVVKEANEAIYGGKTALGGRLKKCAQQCASAL